MILRLVGIDAPTTIPAIHGWSPESVESKSESPTGESRLLARRYGVHMNTQGRNLHGRRGRAGKTSKVVPLPPAALRGLPVEGSAITDGPLVQLGISQRPVSSENGPPMGAAPRLRAVTTADKDE